MKFYQGEYSGLIEFSAAVAENPFGATLLGFVENQYEDIDTAILDIQETLSEEGYEVNEEIVLGLMTGEILPEQEVVEILSELGTVMGEDDEIDEEATERNQAKLYDGAIAAYELAGAELDSEDESNEDEDDAVNDSDEVDETDAEAEVVDEEPSEQDATFSRYFEQQDAMQERMVVTDTLSDLRDYAEELKGKRILTPNAFNLLFSRRAKDDYVNFSQAVEGTEYTPEEYLMCMEFSLSLFEELGPVPGTSYMFSNIVDQEISDSPVNFSANEGDVNDEARDLLSLLHGVKDTAKESE